jgi:hypothetical protein
MSPTPVIWLIRAAHSTGDASQPVQLSLIRLDFCRIGDPRLPKTWFWVAEKRKKKDMNDVDRST